MSPQLLMKMHSQLDFSLVHHAMFWAGAMVISGGTFRKSNLFLSTSSEFCSNKQFVREDFISSEDGTLVINVKYSKTI